MHGRVEGATDRCAAPGCDQVGEYRAPVEPANFNGPGSWRLLCLDHVREHNAKYNYFNGMSPDEIAEAQTPYAGWLRSTRVFTGEGGDPAPPWRDFTDPLDAIAARFRSRREAPSNSRFSLAERRALSVLGLSEDADRTALRKRYSQLVRRYHPDRNGGDRSFETRLQAAVEAYQLLRRAAAFA